MAIGCDDLGGQKKNGRRWKRYWGYSSRGEKISTGNREKEKKYDKGTHRGTFKMRRDLVTLNDTRRGSRLSSGY